MATNVTLADRLHAVIGVVAPKAAALHKATGNWPNMHPSPGTKRDEDGNPVNGPDGKPLPARHSGAPYYFETLADGRRRVRVYGEDGDIFAGIGDDIEGAIANLETKVKGGATHV